MTLLIQYTIAVVIVILFLLGSILLSLRLRIREKIDQQPKETVQSEVTDDQLKRGLLRALKGEYTRLF